MHIISHFNLITFTCVTADISILSLERNQFHHSVIVAILHYSANLILTLLYLSKLRSRDMCIIQMQIAGSDMCINIGTLVMTCNFNGTRVPL